MSQSFCLDDISASLPLPDISIRFEVLKPNFLRLWLSTQAGTYIKEFVHGDFGRTSPSLRTLLECAADILSLDVEAINMEWPPAV
eukprot:m.40750 g.40750  ORF g.40750 m.40750 type:complete len:85 (+) comp5630_c0_seq3:95-349(+)